MNPLLARADELEKQRRQAEMLRGMTSGMSPAMTTQMTDEQRAILEQQAAQDPATKEAMMAEMLRTGSDALFNTGVAQGKTIGDIYVAPTWSEALNNAVKQGIGGYQMGKARRGLEEAQATRNEASTAKGTLTNALRKEEADQLAQENKFKSEQLAQNAKEAELRAEEARADRQSRERIAELDRQATMANNAADLAAAEARYGAKSAKEDEKAVAKRDQYVRDYSRDLIKAGVPKAQVVSSEVWSVLEPFKKEDGSYGPLPGVGYGQNVQLGGIGQGLTLASDLIDKGTELATGETSDKPSGKDVKQAVQKMMNVELVSETGMAQTVQEALRQKLGSGFDPFSSDENLIKGLQVIDQIMKEKESTIGAGYAPEVIDTYQQRKGGTTKPAEKTVVRTGKRKSDGATVKLYSDGTQEVIPNG